MKAAQKLPTKERRKSLDFWFYLARILTISSWIAFLVAIYISYFVAPETNYGVLRYYKIEVRKFWLTPLTGYLYLIIWFSAAGIYAATLIDKYRSRRRNDNTNYNAYFYSLLILFGYHLFCIMSLVPVKRHNALCYMVFI